MIIELTNTIQPPNNLLVVVSQPAVVNEISKLKDVEILKFNKTVAF